MYRDLLSGPWFGGTFWTWNEMWKSRCAAIFPLLAPVVAVFTRRPVFPAHRLKHLAGTAQVARQRQRQHYGIGWGGSGPVKLGGDFTSLGGNIIRLGGKIQKEHMARRRHHLSARTSPASAEVNTSTKKRGSAEGWRKSLAKKCEPPQKVLIVSASSTVHFHNNDLVTIWHRTPGHRAPLINYCTTHGGDRKYFTALPGSLPPLLRNPIL